jgi:ribonuclease P protein component
MRETHVPAQHQETQEASRVPVSHAYPRRASRAQDPAPARPHAPLGLIGRVRGRAIFAVLARAERHARGSIAVRGVPTGEASPPRVAYAVGQRVGNAVARNRVRRRLRAAARVCEPKLAAGAAYLVSAEREVLTMPFEELVETLGDLFEATASEGRSGR